MIEPRDKDWRENADWSALPRIEPRIPSLLAHCKAHWPEKEVLVFDERRFTYGEMEAKSALLARQLLAFGIGKGTRIGLILPSDETFLVTWMAITRVGGIAVTISSLSTPAEIKRIAAHSDLHVLFAAPHYLHHDYVARIQEAFPAITRQRIPYRMTDAPALRAVWLWSDPAEPHPSWVHRVDLCIEPDVDEALLAGVEAQIHSSDPAGIIYTSGSTAEPKGVIHSQGNFIRQGMSMAASFRYRHDERAYASMPFFWIGGLVTTAMCVMSVGATMLTSATMGTALLDFLERERTTAVVTWPHILRALAADPTFLGRDWSAMRNGLLYEALPAGKRPKDPTLMSAPLGMTETCGPYAVMQRHLPEDQRGSVGPLMRGVEARLLDPDTGHVLAVWPDGDTAADSGGQIGVMHLRNDTMMLGIVKLERADVFTADGWYDTGDLCSFRHGHLHYHGRADDLIKASGANVSPREVETALMQIAGVASANVAAVPDRARGNIVGAVIVPDPGTTLEPDVLRREAAKSLSSYKVPRVIVVMEAARVPMLSSSKVDRRAIAQILREAHEG